MYPKTPESWRAIESFVDKFNRSKEINLDNVSFSQGKVDKKIYISSANPKKVIGFEGGEPLRGADGFDKIQRVLQPGEDGKTAAIIGFDASKNKWYLVDPILGKKFLPGYLWISSSESADSLRAATENGIIILDAKTGKQIGTENIS